LAPDEHLLGLSSHTVAACTLTEQLVAVDVKNINSVVAMIPRMLRLPLAPEEDEGEEYFCVLSQPGLDVSVLGMAYNIFEDDDNGEGNVE
jgi:hypothetical protein